MTQVHQERPCNCAPLGLVRAMGQAPSCPKQSQSVPQIMHADGIEQLRDREMIARLREELKDRGPNVLRVMLHERDELMAKHLLTCGGKRVLAVVGAAHLDGLETHWLEQEKQRPC
eukprot:s102_g32.t2